MQKQLKSFPFLRFEEFKDNWNIRKLGQCINQITGYAFKGNDITEDENGTPLLRGINITEGKIRHNKKIDRYFSGHIKKFEKYLLETGDLVLGMDGSKVGKNVALVTQNDRGSLLIQRVARLRAKEGVSINFIYQNINNSKFHRYVDIVNTSSGIPHISSKQINNFKIGLPSLPEQQKIASFLSAVDKRIELLQKKKDLLEDYKKGVMQKLFSQQIRFKDDNGNDFPDWEENRLEEFLVKHDEKSTENNQYPVLTSSRKGIFFQKDYYNDNQIASKDNTGYNVVPRNYFTYRHMSDDLVFKFNINDIVDKGIVSTLYPVFTTKNMDDSYLKLLLNNGNAFKRYALLQKQGGSRTYMYFSKLQKLMVNLPCLEEQKKIASFLSAIDSKIETTSQQIEGMQTFKKGLLQQMFV